METENNYTNLLNDFSSIDFDLWKKEVEDSLKGKPYNKLVEKSFEEIEINPIYSNHDLIGLEKFLNSVPGFEPFARGNEILGNKSKIWKIAQKVNHPDLHIANKQIKNELLNGSTAINVKLFFADSKFEVNEKIPSGVHIYQKSDFDILFEGIEFEKFPIFVYLSGNIGLGYKETLNWFNDKSDNLYIAFDPISNNLSKGFFVNDFDNFFNLINNDKSKNRILCLNTALYQNAGASATQEIAFLLAIVNFFLNNYDETHVNKLLESMWINTSIGSNYFMEIAKLRAMRILISKLFSLYDLEQKVEIHAKTSSMNKTKLDCYTNMLRLSIESFAAAVGGADSIETGTFDEMFGISNEFSRRYSRNIQLILQQECNLESIIDPAGGSYYVEKITNELAQKAWELFQHIENIGGITQIIKDGQIQKWITAKANERTDRIKSRKDILLGVNKYANMNEKEIESLKINFDLLKSRIELAKKVQNSFINIDFSMDNFTEVSKIEKLILAKPFEELRDISIEYQNKNNGKAKVFFANFGLLKEYKPRADFATDFFTVGNFEIINPKGFQTIEDAVTEFFKTDAKVICICSADDKYPEIVSNLVRLVERAKPLTQFILAGYPTDKVEEYKSNGIDDFIHIKANIYEVLTKLYDNIDY